VSRANRGRTEKDVPLDCRKVDADLDVNWVVIALVALFEVLRLLF
jgi:hypothetical protein